MSKVTLLILIAFLFSCSRTTNKAVEKSYVAISDTCILDLAQLRRIESQYKQTSDEWNAKYDSIKWCTDIDLALYLLPEKEMNDTREFMRIRGRAIEWNTKYRMIEGILKLCEQ